MPVRVLVAAPFRHDSTFIEEALAPLRNEGTVCQQVKQSQLEEATSPGETALVATQEALTQAFIDELSEVIAKQPAWSRIPVILLLDEGIPHRSLGERLLDQLEGADVIVLLRPCYLLSFRSSVRNALALLEQQQSVRDLLRLERDMRAEIDHRMKNQLMTVLSLYHTSRRQSRSLQQLDEVFGVRIKALSDVHALLRRNRKRPAVAFFDLCAVVFAPYKKEGQPTVETTGEPFSISGDTAMILSLVLNELATNATKYGAFASHEGIVRIKTRIGEDDVTMTWNESRGPPVEAPQSTSYGTDFIKSSARMLGGTALFDYRKTGLAVEFSLSKEKILGGDLS